MAEGSGHDHASLAQHPFACNVIELASLDFKDVVPEPMMFGEADIAGDRLVVATDFPAAGFLTLDVSDPSHPRVLSRYRGTACETETDTDCGADVKLTPDGRYAFLAIQRSSRASRPESRRITPGIDVVNVSDPAHPHKTFFQPVPPRGVHMLAYHTIGGQGYVFARAANAGASKLLTGVDIFRFDPVRGTLAQVNSIVTSAAHDVSLYDDPVDHKTYLDVSGAQSGILYFYDVSDVMHPVLAGQWKPPPELPGNVWYMHNAWTFRDGAKRYTFAGPELYSVPPGLLGLPPGHGAAVGPLWLLDTTDFAHPRLIGEWRNPGNHIAGNLVFSPHNTWYAGGGVTWSAHYHGGVWILDWSDVMAGKAKRPREIGYDVPHTNQRMFVTSNARSKFVTAPELLVRPLVWDVVVKGRYGFVTDINGGLSVVERAGATRAPASSKGEEPPPNRTGLIVLAIVIFGALPAFALLRRRR